MTPALTAVGPKYFCTMIEADSGFWPLSFNGVLTQKPKVYAKGEVAALAETINNMTKALATLADQVTTVAREVGVDLARGLRPKLTAKPKAAAARLCPAHSIV